MATYAVGDLQGCLKPLQCLLERVAFDPAQDKLWLVGDLVNRGPQSLATLRFLYGMRDALTCVLGNHDLHLLATAHGARKPSRRDTLDGILQADDRDALLDWLRQQPLAMAHEHGGESLLMLHAGTLPTWSPTDLLRLAGEVHAVLRGNDLPAFLHQMYGNQPDHWMDTLTGTDRLRVIVNALTRLRFCSPDGVMDFESTESAGSAPPGLLPWFDVPGRRTAGTLLAFGHWSTLGFMNRPDLLALDTGCVWGGQLSAMRFGATLGERELLQVQCPQAQTPG